MPEPLNIHHQKRLLAHFFLINYLLALFVTKDSVAFAHADGLGALTFLIATFLCYGFLYLLPAILLTGLTRRLSNLRRGPQAPARAWPANAVAVAASGATLLFLYVNAKIYALYGMYVNGFIINLLVTPGGIESLGGSAASERGFMLIALGFFAAQALLLWLVRVIYARALAQRQLPRRFYRFGVTTLVTAIVGVHMHYAYDAFAEARLGALAQSIPFFQPVTARSFFTRLGLEGSERRDLDIEGKLHYPLAPLQVTPPAKPYNVIWLVSESWRADMLDAEIMPHTWQFAQDARRYTRNYSGGNGTRMGVFSMFMGMPGNYWFPFLRERRGAAIIDVLQQQHYQMSLYTSARFSYPEFDRTIFSAVPQDALHWRESGEGWEKDRDNVTDMLKFIDGRDPAKPFFSFMFFESPHARYYFPPESAIRTPYRDDINYATLDKEALARNIDGIKNRYINSVHHLDSQFGRVFDYLKANRLLDSTIVVLVGDHGEEFMEHGFWGHNSTFVDEQIRTPLVIRVPGRKPAVSDAMTSHMDIVPTLMPLLGVQNPAGDYAIGYDLLDDAERSHTYVSDWDRIAYIDDDIKLTQSVNIKSYSGMHMTTADDAPVTETQQQRLLQDKQPALTGLVRDMGKFLQRP